jgi:hypothetical protein
MLGDLGVAHDLLGQIYEGVGEARYETSARCGGWAAGSSKNHDQSMTRSGGTGLNPRQSGKKGTSLTLLFRR